jgi:tRNA(fMet)-specific endonuclease VapC
MYVLDTNTLIYFFKGIGNVADILFSKSPDNIKIPAIVLYELEFGIARSTSPRKRKQQLAALTATIDVLPFSTEAAKSSASIRAQLEKSDKAIGPYDVLIAGTALVNQGTLVTHNVKEFNRVKGLISEDWY